MRDHMPLDPQPTAFERKISARAKYCAKITGNGRRLARDLLALAQGLRIPIDGFLKSCNTTPGIDPAGAE